MRGVKTGVSLVVSLTLLAMIRRYCAEHDVGLAMNTFYAYKVLKFYMGIDEFQSLHMLFGATRMCKMLSSLCFFFSERGLLI